MSERESGFSLLYLDISCVPNERYYNKRDLVSLTTSYCILKKFFKNILESLQICSTNILRWYPMRVKPRKSDVIYIYLKISTSFHSLCNDIEPLCIGSI